MVVLGINAFHADAAACLLVDGNLVVALEEERLRRVKHWPGFPDEAIKACLSSAGLELRDINHIAINRNPRANFAKQAELANAAGVGLSTLRRVEASSGPIKSSAENVWKIQQALEKSGVTFINGNGGGPGARLANPNSQ